MVHSRMRSVTTWMLALVLIAATLSVAPPPTQAVLKSAPAAAVNSPTTAADTSPKYMPVSPARLLDTRETKQRLRSQGTLKVKATGVAGVPQTNVQAVSINLTAVDPGAKGYLTAYPAGMARPLVSSLNFRAGENTANHVIVPVGANGEISIYAHVAADVIVDITGYTPAGSGLQTVSPRRALDTRTLKAPLSAGGTRRVPMSGRYGIPATGVDAVIVNVTAVDPQGKGYFTAYPSGKTRAVTSTLNFNPGENTANNATVKLGDDGAINIYSHVKAHLIVDVVGYVKAKDAFAAIAPARSVDTRKLSLGKMRAGETRTLRIAGRLGLPASGITAVAVNAVAINPAAKGYLALFPADVRRPLISAVNFDAGDNTANNALVKLSADGAISVFSLVDAHVAIDIVGYTTAAMPYNGSTTTTTKGRTTTTVRKANTPTTINTKPAIPALAAAALDKLLKQGSIVGTPVDLSLPGEFPRAGVRLEKTYPAPLPDDATVSFIYWDTTVNAWIPQPGVISADRRSAHAIVTHYSLWGDVINSVGSNLGNFAKAAGDAFTQVGKAVEKTIVDVVDTMAYEIGSFVDSRTKPQKCDTPLPAWVKSGAFIEPHFNNPVHWCVQGVPGDGTKVAISAKANRGHGFVLQDVPDGMVVTNDSFDTDLYKTLTNITTGRGSAIANSPMAVLYSANYIPPGATVTITFDEETYYEKLKQRGTVKVTNPHWLVALSSIIVTQLVGAGEGLVGGRAAAAILVSNCWVKSAGVEELQGNTLGIWSCLDSAEGLKDFDVPVTAAARTVALKANLTIAMLGLVNNGMVFGLDTMLNGAAYEATVFGASSKRTRVYEIAPFDTSGALKSGWSIVDKTADGSIGDCYRAYTSVTAGVMDCGPSAFGCGEAFYLRKTAGYAYCHNFNSKELRKVVIDSPNLEKNTGRVYPAKILTADGSLYYKRYGGSWPSYGQYYATYGCASGPCEKDWQMVVVNSEVDNEDTFDRRNPMWRVRVAVADSRETVPAPPWVDVAKVWFLRNSTFS